MCSGSQKTLKTTEEKAIAIESWQINKNRNI